MQQEEQYLTYKQLSERFNIPVGTAYSLVSKNQIPFIRISRRIIRFRLSEIEKWLDFGANKNIRQVSND